MKMFVRPIINRQILFPMAEENLFKVFKLASRAWFLGRKGTKLLRKKPVATRFRTNRVWNELEQRNILIREQRTRDVCKSSSRGISSSSSPRKEREALRIPAETHAYTPYLWYCTVFSSTDSLIQYIFCFMPFFTCFARCYPLLATFV